MAIDVELTPAELADRAIPRMPSSVFRVAYVTLEHTVAVTSNGRVFAYFVPVSPTPRTAQHPAADLGRTAPADAPHSPGAAGRSEAPGLAADASPSESSSTPKASRRRASRARASVSAAPTPAMTQAERDRVLRRVNRTGNER